MMWCPDYHILGYFVVFCQDYPQVTFCYTVPKLSLNYISWCGVSTIISLDDYVLWCLDYPNVTFCYAVPELSLDCISWCGVWTNISLNDYVVWCR